MITLEQIDQAAGTIYRHMHKTPQYAWPKLAARTGAEVWLKHENHTPTGAFKVRGGLVFMDEARRSAGTDGHPPRFISATRGNHGQSLAFAGRRHGIPVTICVPKGNSRDQNAAILGHGAELVEHGNDFEAARRHSIDLAAERGLEVIPPYHPLLMRGVATYARELFDAAGALDTVYVPIGMGSGICGLITVRDLLGLKTEIVGVVSAHAPCFALSFEAGRIVSTETADTFADGVACRQPLEEPFEIISKGAARIVTVTDDEAAAAIAVLHEDAHTIAEGASGVAAAGMLKEVGRAHGRRIAAIVTGSNVDAAVYARAISEPQSFARSAVPRTEHAHR